MTIKVKYHSTNSRPITQAHDGEWFDLKTAKGYTLDAGESALLDLGVSIQIPEGYEAILAPRSSTYKNFKILLTNGIGVIDEKFCGENDVWRMPVLAMYDTNIPVGSRVAQFRIQKIQPKVDVVEVERMSSEDRGGLGSTGM